ncbi:MAG: UMP kinase [candidate division Zixibacteria bacterium]|nr:UMP kinase [candidate division Zixibacteria bacterium]
MPSDLPTAVFKRILLKLSGEALVGPGQFGIHTPTVVSICSQIKEIHQMGVEVAVVVGGGNIFRGMNAAERGMDRVTADNMGMLATVMNSLAMMDTLEQMGIFTRVMSAVKIEAFAEPYIRRRAIRHMEKRRLVILAAGTGNPFFSTDTAAALRAMEIGANLMIKATNVDGVYSADPKKDPNATFFSEMSYMDVLTRELRVMDSTAISLLKDNNIPVRVVDINRAGNLRRVVSGEPVGTLIS